MDRAGEKRGALMDLIYGSALWYATTAAAVPAAVPARVNNGAEIRTEVLLRPTGRSSCPMPAKHRPRRPRCASPEPQDHLNSPERRERGPVDRLQKGLTVR